MWGDRSPEQWSPRVRLAVSAVSGVLWAFLWIGLPRDAFFLFLFPLASAAIIGPTLGAVAGDRWNSYSRSVALAVAASALASLALAVSVDLTIPTGGRQWLLYIGTLGVSWIPAAAVAAWMVRRRRHARPIT